MKQFSIFGLLAIATLMVQGVSAAHAQGPYCGGGGWGCGANFPYGLYGSRVNDVPYFAMFPPVYYSYPVPRTYGWSPFAYPPGTMTPEMEASVPEEILNPYIPENKDHKEIKPTAEHTAAIRRPEPQVVINPFVKTPAILATASTQMASK
ncbi:MAG TPA: hypothetical protein VGJ04_00825 [Pirellulales bacterium]